MTNNKKLVEFLNELALLIEQNKIEPDVLQDVGEFYMKIKFKSDNLNKDDDEQLIKYLSAGYYIYNNIDIENIKNVDSA